MEPDWVSECGTVKLWNRDCLDVLPTLEAGSVDAVVTDPPYGINTKSDGNGKLSPWGDLCNSSLWYREWIAQGRRITRESGCLWSFFNWRSIVTFQKASCDLGWPIESLLVWDKEWIGPGGTRGLRPSYELVGLWCRESFFLEDRGLPDIQRFKWSSIKPTGHPAEKPIDLMVWIIEQSTNKGNVVCDPFLGSGTSGAAAARLGRSFIGIEQDEAWFTKAVDRIEAELNRMPLFPEPKETQRELL